MPERGRSLPTPEQNLVTIFKRLMLGKQTPRTRDAYAPNLRDFARFLGINSYQDVHPLATVPDNAWQQLGHHKAHYANRMNSKYLYFDEANAILDRLLRHSTTLNIRGQSYRLKDKQRSGVFHNLTNNSQEGGLTPDQNT